MSPDQTFNAKAFDYYPRLNKVRKYFETHYARDFSLEDAAEIAGCESKHFGKYFKGKVGIGFKEWTSRTRIDVAAVMMRLEHQELQDIALAVGYEEYRTFERAFKKYTGFTPRQYRKSYDR